MVQFAVATSVALLQLAMLAQTSYGLPIESGNEFEARAIMDNTDSQLFKREQMELETREPLGALVKAGIALTGVGVGYLVWKHFHDKKKVQQAQGAQGTSGAQGTPPPSAGANGGGTDLNSGNGSGGGYGGGNRKRDLEERYWDEVLEERGLLDELD